jgi:N-acetylmuramoyl-L-alanine amidase
MKKIVRFLTGKTKDDQTVPDENGADFYNGLSADVLARTLWGEARGEGAAGMEAVANVVLNRIAIAAAHGGAYWWGCDVISVCQKPYQFSCWNRADPNYRQLLAAGEKDIHFATALRIARRAMALTLPDHTGGATHYHEKSILPAWAKGERPTAIIGRHMFYKLT